MLLLGLIGFVLLAVLFREKIGILLAGACLFAVLAFLPAPTIIAPQANGLVWQVWSDDATASARAEGQLVLVDVTADWCITCKANKALVLETAPIAPMLATLVDDGKLVMLKADWTRPNPGIAAFLASHDRFGIPFNIIYGPKAPSGVSLGELLRADMVEAALIKAGMVR